MNARLALMLLLSAVVHGWLLQAAPAAYPVSPPGDLVLNLGTLRLPAPPPAPEPAQREEIGKKPKPAEPPPEQQMARATPATSDAQTKTESVSVPETEFGATADRAAPPAAAGAEVEKEEPVLVEVPAFASPPGPPVYPALARQRRQQGTVVVEVRLGEGGEQLQHRLLQSSGVAALDQAALAAVQSWEFLPYRENGRARTSRVRLPIRFAL